MWIKVFGVRDIVLGAAALHPGSTVRRANLRAGIALDLIDAAVVANAARRGLPLKAALVGMALAGELPHSPNSAPRWSTCYAKSE
ncbi:hypothetical protein [Rhodococcus sp. RD6.2]|uniref:hypothetical protein n=1 Tax=Rhodococcus sp. RD6.2 TaxID=260936 RepID=UPI0012EE1799|nr:hypothetical protein [Rhodococcus sp. RD6.2]